MDETAEPVDLFINGLLCAVHPHADTLRPKEITKGREAQARHSKVLVEDDADNRAGMVNSTKPLTPGTSRTSRKRPKPVSYGETWLNQPRFLPTILPIKRGQSLTLRIERERAEEGSREHYLSPLFREV